MLSGTAPVNAFLFRSKLDSIQIVYDRNQLVLPNESFNISVIAYRKNGKVRKTKGIIGRTVGWWRYRIEVQGGKNSGGRIMVNPQLLPSKGKYISISVIPKKQEELKKRMLIPLNYETKIDYLPNDHFDKAPGCVVKGKIISKFNNGQTRVYNNLHKKREANRFKYATKDGIWSNGKFTIEPNFLKISNHHSALIVRSKLNVAVSDTFDILLDYKHHYKLRFWGRSGSDGRDGFRGSCGSMGSDGSDGENGYHGQHGENAPDIGVWADLFLDPILGYDLLYVYAENFWSGKEYHYLINPNGGAFHVSSTGGRGGDGGDGGNGGNGGKGKDGRIWYEIKKEKRIVRKPFRERVIVKEKKKVINDEGEEEEIEVERAVYKTVYRDVEETVEVKIKHQDPGEDGGNGGNGGDGGFGGCGGNGGNIYLHFTDDAKHYQHLFTSSNHGGSGGSQGSAGNGGNGGHGGYGCVNGNNGNDGSSGRTPRGFPERGYHGETFIETCDEFVEMKNELILSRGN